MDWTIYILFLVIGAVIGFAIAKLMAPSDKSDSAAIAKNQQLEAELQQYKQDVEQHFSDSADLLGNMAQEYSKVYSHMAQAQQSLLPDSDLTIKIPFVEEKEPSLVKEAIEEVEIEAAANDAKAESAQPNDYVTGSHGIINPEKEAETQDKKPA
mgnify:CR=1 FL=1